MENGFSTLLFYIRYLSVLIIFNGIFYTPHYKSDYFCCVNILINYKSCARHESGQHSMKKILLTAALGMAAVMASAAIQPEEISTFTGTLEGFVYETNEPYLVEYFMHDNQMDYTYNIYNSSLEKVWSYTGYIQGNHNYSMDTDIDGDSFYFSQYLFNTDDEFEFFLQKERSAANPEYEGQTEIYGFQLMQSNGNAIIDLDFDQPLPGGNSINFYTYQLGNYKLILELNYYHNGDYYIRYMYDPTSQGGTMQLISKGQMKAYPNPVKAGDMFKISGVKDIKGATVTVNRMDGSLVNAFTCDATVAEIPTGGMANGMYLYTVTRNGKVLATGKIIVE